MKNFNPFNIKAPKDNRMVTRMKERQDQFFADLEKKASGK